MRIACNVKSAYFSHFRYLKFYKKCLSDRKKLGIGCSEVDCLPKLSYPSYLLHLVQKNLHVHGVSVNYIYHCWALYLYFLFKVHSSGVFNL